MLDPYKTLGVARDASADQVKAAYRRMAVKTHPDKTGGDDEEFKRVAEAYEILSDPHKRRAHDAPSPAGFEAFFSSMRKAVPCDPFQVSIPLSAIVNGTRQRITVTMPHMCNQCSGKGTRDETLCVTCPTCKGTGRITQTLGGMFSVSIGACPACKGRAKVIPSAAKCKGCGGEGTAQRARTIDIDVPPGTPDGHAFVLEGIGSYDTGTGKNRDVRVTVKWSLPPNVRIYGRDIHTTISCTLDEVLGGYTKTIDLYGTPIEVAREGYANPTTPIVKPGMGISGGDLVVNVDTKWPDAWSR